MSARTARARKLLAVESSRVAAREHDLALARRALEEKEAAAHQAASAALDAHSRWLDVCSTSDLQEASARRQALEAQSARAADAVQQAAAVVRAREADAVAARIAERRFEILIEGFLRADAAREQKIERRNADEHAARKREAP